jgi:hypothetical protein
MFSPLTLENSLLLACARTAPEVPRLQALVARGPDWPRLLRQVERWGLAPLVYTNLQPAAQSGHVPQPVMERLRHLYHRTRFTACAGASCCATLQRFAEANVPVIVLKGAALATLVYASPALRPMGDIDLLVHRRDQDRVEAVLRSLREAPPEPALGPERFALLDIRQHLLPAAAISDRRRLAAGAPPDRSVATLVLSPGSAPAWRSSWRRRAASWACAPCATSGYVLALRGRHQWRALVTRAAAYHGEGAVLLPASGA